MRNYITVILDKMNIPKFSPLINNGLGLVYLESDPEFNEQYAAYCIDIFELSETQAKGKKFLWKINMVGSLISVITMTFFLNIKISMKMITMLIFTLKL